MLPLFDSMSSLFVCLHPCLSANAEVYLQVSKCQRLQDLSTGKKAGDKLQVTNAPSPLDIKVETPMTDNDPITDK